MLSRCEGSFPNIQGKKHKYRWWMNAKQCAETWTQEHEQFNQLK